MLRTLSTQSRTRRFALQTLRAWLSTSVEKKERDARLVLINPHAPALDIIPKSWPKTCINGTQGNTRTYFDEEGILTTYSSFDTKHNVDEDEATRRAASAGIRVAREAGATTVRLDVTKNVNAHAAAEGVYLSTFDFTLKTASGAKKDHPTVFLTRDSVTEDGKSWDTGVVYARCQNLARELMELPANMMTPTLFCDRTVAEFAGFSNVTIEVRDRAWAESKNMNAFLSVAKGTSEPPRFLELHYRGGNPSESPMVWVGKGVTFDAGGISIKPSAGMKLMRGDMGGAATVISAALGVVKLNLPINLTVLVPLTENLLGPSANKPGDIVYASNGKSIEIDNTDAEGRLLLADALYYGSSTFKPKTIIDVATLTGAMMISLGGAYSGVFSSSTQLWDTLHTAGENEFDRFWRMPLDESYAKQITRSNADLCNTGGRAGGACTAAWFLRSFVDGIDDPESDSKIRWAHIDIAGSMEGDDTLPYQGKGMTGRPTRALLEFARLTSKKLQ